MESVSSMQFWIPRSSVNNCTESLLNYEPHRRKSSADEFEELALIITSGDCSDYNTRRAESYLKAAHAIRQQELILSPALAGLTALIQSWAQTKKVLISKQQAIRLAHGNEVTVLDIVYRAHPVTGELIVSGTDQQWRKCISRHKVEELIKRWKMTIKNKYKFNAKAGFKYINRFVEGGKYIVSGMRQRIDF